MARKVDDLEHPTVAAQTDLEGAKTFSETAYGHTHIILSRANLEHLQDGGYLTVDLAFGEYTVSIKLTDSPVSTDECLLCTDPECVGKH